MLDIQSCSCGVEKIHEDGGGEATKKIAQTMCDILNVSSDASTAGKFYVGCYDPKQKEVSIHFLYHHLYFVSKDQRCQISGMVAASNVESNKKHGTFLFFVRLPNIFWPRCRQTQVLLPLHAATGPNKVILKDHPQANDFMKEHQNFYLSNAKILL